MLAGIRDRLTYANVVSTLCLFILLGGGAWAAAKIDSDDIVDNSLKSVDLKDAKAVKAADVVPGELVTPGSEDWHFLELNGPPAFDCGWETSPAGVSARYFRDPAGIVHLKGEVRARDGISSECDTDPAADLRITDADAIPPGYQPEHAVTLPVVSNNAPGAITVLPNASGLHISNGFPTFANAKQWVSLDGISWRCGPSGQDGCP